MSPPTTVATSSGEITCIEIFGNDLTVVNCARVSFGVEKVDMDDRDEKLIRYLAANRHYSPFRHVFLRFKIKAPEFVMRQWYKHVVGAEWTSTYASQLHGWNEISGRYVVNDEFYIPTIWRKQSISNKQGSDGVLAPLDQVECSRLYSECIDKLRETYNQLLARGVAKEQARVLLPLATQTEVIWTCGLQAAVNFVDLRSDPHAQLEIREFATVIAGILNKAFPISSGALLQKLKTA